MKNIFVLSVLVSNTCVSCMGCGALSQSCHCAAVRPREVLKD